MGDVFYVARRSFGYGDLDVDKGQLFQLAGARNDEKMIRLGYMEEMKSPGGARPQCGACGVRFMDDVSLNIHGHARHKVMTEEERDRFEDSRLAREETQAPLHLDQTAAALTGQASAGTGRRR